MLTDVDIGQSPAQVVVVGCFTYAWLAIEGDRVTTGIRGQPRPDRLQQRFLPGPASQERDRAVGRDTQFLPLVRREHVATQIGGVVDPPDPLNINADISRWADRYQGCIAAMRNIERWSIDTCEGWFSPLPRFNGHALWSNRQLTAQNVAQGYSTTDETVPRILRLESNSSPAFVIRQDRLEGVPVHVKP